MSDVYWKIPLTYSAFFKQAVLLSLFCSGSLYFFLLLDLDGQNPDRQRESLDRCDIREVTLNCVKMARTIERMIHESFRYSIIDQI